LFASGTNMRMDPNDLATLLRDKYRCVWRFP
jgi:hypothetical protein